MLKLGIEEIFHFITKFTLCCYIYYVCVFDVSVLQYIECNSYTMYCICEYKTPLKKYFFSVYQSQFFQCIYNKSI